MAGLQTNTFINPKKVYNVQLQSECPVDVVACNICHETLEYGRKFGWPDTNIVGGIFHSMCAK